MKKAQGFTLIELMIVVAIVAILASVAYGSYQGQITSSRRSDAQAALMSFAQAMEREYTEEGTYANADGDADDETNASVAPTIFPTEAPLDGDAKFYDLRIINASDTGYLIRAIPKGAQAADGSLQLSSTGRKGWDRNNDGDFDDASETCWLKAC